MKTLTKALTNGIISEAEYLTALRQEVANAGPARQGTQWLADRQREIAAIEDTMSRREWAERERLGMAN
jgi:hypothetical protein